eukprot:scaffold10724_cov112-Skeletonema_dohrnii-CCMP3373.AAC.7
MQDVKYSAMSRHYRAGKVHCVSTDKKKQESCVDDARERYLYLFQQQQQQQQHDAQQQLPPSPPPPPPPPQKIQQQQQPLNRQKLPHLLTPLQQTIQLQTQSPKQKQQQQQQQHNENVMQPIIIPLSSPPNPVKKQPNNPSSRGPISSRTRSSLNQKEPPYKVSTNAKSPRRSQRVLALQTQQERVCPETKVYFKSRTLKSIIERKGLSDAVDQVLSDLFLHPFRKPSSGGNKGIIISINSAYGNPRRLNIDRYTYTRQSFSLSCYDNQQRRRSQRNCTTREGFVYGAGTGSSSFGDSSTQMVCREMSKDMVLIRNTVQEIMEITFKGDKTVNTGELNTCEIICYYNDKGIPFHRDMTYSQYGTYIENKNSQVADTPVVILAVGDTRELEFALHNFYGYRQKDVPKIITLSHGTLFMLHPSDEKDFVRIIEEERCVSHYRHRSKGVKGRKGMLSIGFVFRCCKTRQLLDKSTAQYIIHKPVKSEREMLFDKDLEEYFKDTSLKEDHQKCLQDLYIELRDKYIKK